MTVTRRLVTLLLILSVILGYSETPSLRNVVGVVTSYSTVTSTSYTYEFNTWTSIGYITTTVTALTQTELSGPHVEIKATYSYRYYADGEQIADMIFDSKVKNLMATTIKKGMIRLELASLTGPATEEVLVPFWEIKPGETVDVKQGVPITKNFYRGKVRMYLLRADITCWGLTTMAAVAYTLSGMQTRTIITTYTTAFTQQEPLPTLPTATGGENAWLWILPIVAIAVIGALFFLKRRGIPTKPRTQNLCSNCGAPMEAADDFCTNCGKKRST